LSRRLRASEEKLLGSNRQLEKRVAEQHTIKTLLQHERDLLRTLLDNSPDRIYFKDRESRFLKCGKAVNSRLEINDASLAVGKTDFDFFAEEHARQHSAWSRRLSAPGNPAPKSWRKRSGKTDA
jgi:PAS domain-containing protein